MIHVGQRVCLRRFASVSGPVLRRFLDCWGRVTAIEKGDLIVAFVGDDGVEQKFRLRETEIEA